jgi:hypothetical protein
MSTPVDKKMSNEQAMFLPDYLMEGFREAQIDGHPIVAQTIQILPSKLDFKQTRNTPRIIFWVFAIFVFLFSFSQPHRMVYFDTFFFLVIGLLGGFMLFMWFGTDHQSCSWNRNLLWALPAHLIFAFAIPRNASWIQQYARIAIGLILFGLVWNLFAAQVYIVEITPIVLLLLWRLNHYRRDPAKAQLYANVRTIFSKIR